MNVIVNGQPFQIEAPVTLAQLLVRLQLPHQRVAVEHNQQVVPRAQWETQAVGEGDQIEVVQFVGGGSQ